MRQRRLRTRDDMAGERSCLRHNETAASKDLELLEISVPADMGTVACEPPEGWSKGA